jgi:uncharacterized protein YbbC (DUF1343 family)
MYKNNILPILYLSLLFSVALHAQNRLVIKEYNSVVCGSQQFTKYLPLLKNKRVGVVTNITGVIGKTSIVDTLLKLKVNVKKIFGPEHGFRSDTEAGEKVQSNKDKRTGLTVMSLYGSNKKPTKEQLQDLDVVVYDIQDIGVRFYTYISTLCYVMEACAESGKELIVLDRPNPNGFYIDGPVLKEEFKSFLGLHAVPLVYGMTTGEYATMANEEGWLKDKVKCRLSVIKMQKYERKASYKLPVKPSPNIPNSTAVLLYPGLGLFEGTIVSLGRGTAFPFQVIGHPAYSDTSFSFTPKPTELTKEPKYFNKRCFGLDLRKENYLVNHPKKIELQGLMMMYTNLKGNDFFDKNFNFHAGNSELQSQIKAGLSEEDIRKSWQADMDAFKLIRKKYLLYADF